MEPVILFARLKVEDVLKKVEELHPPVKEEEEAPQEPVIDIEPKEEEPDHLTVVIVQKGDSQAGLVVDNLIGQQEIVIKSLGKYINGNKLISGATILGDGEVALILDVNTLM